MNDQPLTERSLIDTPGGPYARVVLDSISPQGQRLISVEAKIHRFVLAELNTHRAFSRNSASSRAIPVKNTIARITHDPALPLWWGANQAGMQARAELEGQVLDEVEFYWNIARRNAIDSAMILLDCGLHKQLVNRLLEPFAWHVVLITATEWDNFFAQRCHPDAQSEMRAAAEAIREAIAKSTPERVDYQHWHMPYITAEEHGDNAVYWRDLRRVSVARCARVSYLTHDGRRSIDDDLALYDKLMGAEPKHWSPTEHVATPAAPGQVRLGNFDGWHQLRHWSLG